MCWPSRSQSSSLGFKFSGIKTLLGTHAHGDHQEGDAMVKQLSGAQVMDLAKDVPALRAITPGGKPHPLDRTLHAIATRDEANVACCAAVSWVERCCVGGGRQNLIRQRKEEVRAEH